MKVEKLSKKDYSEILKVWEASVRATHHFLKESDIAFYKEIIPHTLDNIQSFGIREKNKLIGYISVSEDNIEMLFVEPKAFGKGVGTELINHAINNLGKKKVDVNEQNEKASKFYQKIGFSVSSRSELDDQGKPYPILRMEL